MKKILIMCAVLVSCMRLVALPLGNPVDPSLIGEGLICQNRYESQYSTWPLCYGRTWSLRLGFYGDYVFNQKLVQRETHRPNVHLSQLNTNGAYVALNLWDRLDIFTVLGATNLNWIAEAITPPLGTFKYLLQTDTHFSWSVGLRATLLEWQCWGIGAEAQYFRAKPNMNFAGVEGVEKDYLNDSLTYQEWQIGGGIAYRFNFYNDCSAFVPYIGIKWNGCHVDIPSLTITDNTVQALPFQLVDLRKNVYWGYAIGLTLVTANRASITVEGRFRDQTAVQVNGQLRF